MSIALPRAGLAEGYWIESRRPLASLLFIAPLLIVYEAGVLALGTQAMRNGADLWLRSFLELLDFGQYFLLPVLVVCILMGWHYALRQPWRISAGTLSGMAVESVLLAIVLRLILHLQSLFWQTLTGPAPGAESRTALGLSMGQTVGRWVGFLGAGVYEELLFRMILLLALGWCLRRAGMRRAASVIAAVALGSLIFALAHHVGRYGDPVALGQLSFWFTLLFRFLAGVFFSILFLHRGFGIAAGAHAGYDILVGLV